MKRFGVQLVLKTNLTATATCYMTDDSELGNSWVSIFIKEVYSRFQIFAESSEAEGGESRKGNGRR